MGGRDVENMMRKISSYAPRSGRILRENNSIANEADGINQDGSQNTKLTGTTIDLPTKPGAVLEVSGSASVVNADVIPMTDVSQCTDITLQLFGTFAATITFQGSNDGVNWVSVIGQNVSTAVNAPALSSTLVSMQLIPTPFKFFRARITSYTSGTVSGALTGNRQTTGLMTIGGSIGISTSGNTIQLAGSNSQIYDGSAVWANSAVANTNKDIDITMPTALQVNAMYEITVTNPSAITDITILVKNKETLGGSAKYPELTRFGVAKSMPDGKSVLVQGWMLGEAARLSLSNDTVLGAADTFTAYVRVRKV